jgi:hypothetical protein
MLLRCGRETEAHAAGTYDWQDRRDTRTGGVGDIVGWRFPA